MINNKNAFTLVELLAVIVILSVVILIAVTAVIPRMNNAKKKAFIDEALIYLKAGKEAYTTDQNTECYNINDLENYVRQNKDGYSGTLFVTNERISLNLTDGKYYIKTSTNKVTTTSDVLETAPNDFIDTCSDTTSTYTITYNLDGGTLGVANPSTYNVNTPTFTLNNPTKSGYRFVGWSGGKNLFNVNASREVSGKYITLDGTLTTSAIYAVYKSYVNPNKTYVIHNSGKSQAPGCVVYDASGTRLSGIRYYNTAHKTFTTGADASYILYSVIVSKNSDKYDQDYFQIEEGTQNTEYELYVENNTNVVIPRGSSGNRIYTAVWEAI